LRIALIGCGAVSQIFYVPAARLIPEHPIEWFVDLNIERAKQAAKAYGSGNATRDYKETIDKVDAAIVAVPNSLHYTTSIDFLKAGRDVLCEKPLAISVCQASEMVKASQDSGARLAVNFIRRRFDSYRIAREILDRGLVGSVTEVTVEEGDVLGWPFASLFMLQKDKAGGGTLIDWGSHIIDVLHWMFSCDFRVISHRDDSLGRVEGDCETELTISDRGDEIPCNIKLSRSRRLKNNLTIKGDRGSLEVPAGDLHTAYLSVGNYVSKIKQPTSKGKSQVDHFADQIRAFTDKSSSDIANGTEGLKNLMVIEECYRKRQDIIYPWERASKSNAGISISSRFEKILVVGASGFLGTRLVQRLTLDLNAKVRAAIHRPETAARLGRLPVEYAECDVLEPTQVEKCVNGCDVIVSCARDRSGVGKRTLEVFTRGTENLLEAAVKHNVKKFVHISSGAVHGFKHKSPVIDESASMSVTLNPYVKGKIESEKLVMSYSHRFPVVIIRPTLIYGPFSSDWVVGMLERMKNQGVTLIGDNKLANLVYVDDVVDSILLAIEKDKANGEAFIINDDQERILWKDYVGQYSDMLKITPRTLSEGHRISFNLAQHASLLKDSVVAAKSLLGSSEMLALLTQIPLLVVMGAWLIKGQRRNEIEFRLARDLEVLRPDPTAVLKYQTISRDLYDVLTCSTVLSASKAQSMLGFRPNTSFAEGMRKTRMWIEWANIGAPAR